MTTMRYAYAAALAVALATSAADAACEHELWARKGYSTWTVATYATGKECEAAAKEMNAREDGVRYGCFPRC